MSHNKFTSFPEIIDSCDLVFIVLINPDPEEIAVEDIVVMDQDVRVQVIEIYAYLICEDRIVPNGVVGANVVDANPNFAFGDGIILENIGLTLRTEKDAVPCSVRAGVVLNGAVIRIGQVDKSGLRMGESVPGDENEFRIGDPDP